MLKKIFGLLVIAALAVNANDYSGKIGLSFTLFDHTEAGLRIHLLPSYCLNPSVYLSKTGNRTEFKAALGNQIFLFPVSSVDQYINLKLAFEKPEADGRVFIAGSYGAQYLFNDAFAIFGEAGMRIGPLGDNNLSFFNTDAGVTFYLR
jgi:hypothetical protein